ncbi:MAG: VanZ family protein [Flavobacterium sp.]|uniref:VanZ family protein n=1 Tax=unclassified Flavobacterium TaxID=196869 RepID=UPI00265EF0DF|nr:MULTISPECIES: VanZ family protein [unclassified Flavobacterium]MDP3680971.1 VanZ family protein [Flavobacterium sp.]MDZ4330979.1 VanZ family protein [Flavobacterium sp.]WKL42815.1 VanZ family protein [Flavobacterium sp. ZE23DGlu08]
MPKQIYFLAALLWAGVIAFFCLIQLNNVPLGEVSNLDKLVHVFFHFVLTILCFLFVQKYTNAINSLKPILISLLFSVFFGIGIEIAQELFTTTRHADVFDVLANLSGAILGVAVIILFDLKTKIT